MVELQLNLNVRLLCANLENLVGLPPKFGTTTYWYWQKIDVLLLTGTGSQTGIELLPFTVTTCHEACY